MVTAAARVEIRKVSLLTGKLVMNQASEVSMEGMSGVTDGELVCLNNRVLLVSLRGTTALPSSKKVAMLSCLAYESGQEVLRMEGFQLL